MKKRQKEASRKRQENPTLRLRRRAVADLSDETLTDIAGGAS